MRINFFFFSCNSWQVYSIYAWFQNRYIWTRYILLYFLFIANQGISSWAIKCSDDNTFDRKIISIYIYYSDFYKSLVPIVFRLGCLLIINITRLQYILTGYEIKLLLLTYLHSRAVNPRLLYIIRVSNNIIVRRKFCCEFSLETFVWEKVAQRCIYAIYAETLLIQKINCRARMSHVVFSFYIYISRTIKN